MPRSSRAIYRRCPSCKGVRQASEFRRAIIPFNNTRGQLQRRKCPDCAHIAPLMAFPIAERPDPNRGEAP
jgi:hypothetical protein